MPLNSRSSFKAILTNYRISISVVVPIYNLENCIADFCHELKQTMDQSGNEYEIILVDDGSSDKTFEVIKKFIADKHFKIIKHEKNFGQRRALYSGLKVSTGEITIIMDGDGEFKPPDILKLFEEIKKGYDVVSGCRNIKGSKSFLRWSISKIANSIFRIINKTKMKDSFSPFKAFHRRIFYILEHEKDIDWFVMNIGKFKYAEIDVECTTSKKIRSNYSLFKMLKRGLELLATLFYKKK